MRATAEQRTRSVGVRSWAGFSHYQDDLLDCRRIGRKAQALVRRRASQPSDPASRPATAHDRDIHQRMFGHDVPQSISPARGGAHTSGACMTARASHLLAGGRRGAQPVSRQRGHDTVAARYRSKRQSLGRAVAVCDVGQEPIGAMAAGRSVWRSRTQSTAESRRRIATHRFRASRPRDSAHSTDALASGLGSTPVRDHAVLPPCLLGNPGLGAQRTAIPPGRMCRRLSLGHASRRQRKNYVCYDP
jgi:hypothetical protein